MTNKENEEVIQDIDENMDKENSKPDEVQSEVKNDETTVSAKEKNEQPVVEEQAEQPIVDELTSSKNEEGTTTSENNDKNNLSLEILQKQLRQAEKKAEEHWDNLLRKQAEYDNLQKRANRDLEKTRLYALEKFATELLAIKDSIELGIEAAAKSEIEITAIQDGMELTLKMLVDTMEKFNILEINPQDQKFNPQWHEAIATQPIPNVDEGTVVLVQQKGYQLNDRLLRPARVIVAKAPLVEETS